MSDKGFCADETLLQKHSKFATRARGGKCDQAFLCFKQIAYFQIVGIVPGIILGNGEEANKGSKCMWPNDIQQPLKNMLK